MLNTIIFKNLSYRRDGFSAIAMVITLLLLSTTLVTELNRSSLALQTKAIKFKQNYHSKNQALSAIDWGLSQNWPLPTQTWHCQRSHFFTFSACIKLSKINSNHFVILKGQSDELAYYHLTTYADGRLSAQKGHWLDYCPEKKKLDCD